MCGRVVPAAFGVNRSWRTPGEQLVRSRNNGSQAGGGSYFLQAGRLSVTALTQAGH